MIPPPAILAGLAGLALLTGEVGTATQVPPLGPRCATLPNGAPLLITGRGSSNSVSSGRSMANNSAVNDWARQANAYTQNGQGGYGDWNRAAGKNTSDYSQGSGFNRTWRATVVGQPCRSQ